MAHFGVKTTYSQSYGLADIDRSLAAGLPFLTGYLHRGNIDRIDRNAGHWCCVIGKKGDFYVVHDPAGEADILKGGFTGLPGKAVLYSVKNWAKRRWMADGPNTGWGVSLL